MTGGDPRRRVKALSALVVLAVFAAGIAAGFGLSRGCCRREPPPVGGAEMAPPSLQSLHLTAAQEAEAREIGERHRAEIEAIRREVQPRIRAIHERMQKELEPFLTAAQRAQQRDGVGPAGGPADGPPGSPPPMAVEACAGKAASEACGFEGPRGPIAGSCRSVPAPGAPLACVPEGGPPPLR